MSADQEVVTVPYGKYRGNEFTMPQRLSKIANVTDRQNAIVVFGVLLLHYGPKKEAKLLEVDALQVGDVSYWRLCVFGPTSCPSSDQIRLLIEDMTPVKPLAVHFDRARQSHTLVRGVFLTHALVVDMPSVTMALSPNMRAPTAIERVSSESVDEYPSMVEKRSRASTLLRPKPVSAKRSSESRVDKVRQRFKSRSFLARAYDAILGVDLEQVVQSVARREEEEPLSALPEDDDFDQ